MIGKNLPISVEYSLSRFLHQPTNRSTGKPIKKEDAKYDQVVDDHLAPANPCQSMSKRKGKITLTWDDDDADEHQLNPEISIKPTKMRPSYISPDTDSTPLDISKIKDRVLQMDLAENEQIIISGDLLEEGEDNDGDDYITNQELIGKIKAAKEARMKRTQTPDEIEDEEELPFWMRKRNEQDQLESFNEDSRFVREDILNENETENHKMEGFTSFAGGLSRKLLQRDLKSSEFYDTEIGTELIEEDDWQAAQLRKGIDKGWQVTSDDQSAFLAKQSKLPAFIPPPKIRAELSSIDRVLRDESEALQSTQSELRTLQDNLVKLKLQSQSIDFSPIEAEIVGIQSQLASLTAFQALVNKLSVFLQEKGPELEALSSQFSNSDPIMLDVWEHFLDDIEDADLLDLPRIVKTFMEQDQTTALVDILRFYCRYHLMRAEGEEQVQQNDILISSGLSNILESLNNETLVQEILSNIK